MENLTQRCTQLGPFFPKSRHFFQFQKVGIGTPSPPCWAPMIGAEYASISLNMPKYSWKCLNKLFWLCQGSEYAWLPYMFDRLLKIPRVLNKPGFWIWDGCICKGYTEFRICLIMAPYTSIMPEYSSIYLNDPQYPWTWLNIAERLWLCLKIPE